MVHEGPLGGSTIAQGPMNIVVDQPKDRSTNEPPKGSLANVRRGVPWYPAIGPGSGSMPGFVPAHQRNTTGLTGSLWQQLFRFPALGGHFGCILDANTSGVG